MVAWVSCPNEETLLAFADGVLSSAAREEIEAHIDGCVACGDLVADAARDVTHAPGDQPDEEGNTEDATAGDVPFVPPASIGRYTIREALGAGAMGYVVAAFDPELDRRVALKFVQPSRSRRDATHGRQRLIREAQAIARLSHPNVVKVFEVVEAQTTSGSILCIVMELVHGESLRHWLATKPPLPAVLAAFEQAAAGLAAAHDAGVVHRDFKPENVLVVEARNGIEVKVMDFGLARARSLESVMHDPNATCASLLPDVESAADESAADDAVVGATAELAPELTAAGTVIGTPRYMAPEQHRGEEADARSDQFAFCVAAYEALFERRAFRARAYEALGQEKAGPRVGPIPTRRGVPPELTAAILRGLSASRDERFADMRQLVDVIARARAPRSRTSWVIGGLVALFGGGALVLTARSNPAACSARNGAMSEVWNPDARRTLDAAFADVDVPHGHDALPRVLEGLDEYARSWTDTRAAVCASDDSEPLLRDRQLACLDRTLPELGAVVDVLSRPDVGTVHHAMTLVQSLPSPTVCADRVFVSTLVAPPDRDEVAREVLELRRRLAQIVAHGRTGRSHDVWEDALRAVEDASRMAYGPIAAEAQLVLGWLLSAMERNDEAAARLEEAFWSADAADDHAVAARAATTLIFVHGHQRAQLDAGKRWARFAEAALRRVQPHPTAWARYEYNLALVRSDAGAYDEAIDLFTQALERYESAGPGHEIAIATTLNGIAATQARAGALPEARAGFARAAAVWTSTVGPSHPDVALALSNLGTVSIDIGDYDRAQEELERALEITERVLGGEHVSVGDVLLNRGRLHWRRGRIDEARRDYMRAIDLWTPRLSPDHPRIAQAVNNLGVLALEEGDYTGALARFDTALGSWERTLGPRHPRLVMGLENRAEALVASRRFEEAAGSLERALGIVDGSMTGDEAASTRERIVLELARVGQGGEFRPKDR
jgi:eukaryotic-like serine/threonine-protein kinase